MAEDKAKKRAMMTGPAPENPDAGEAVAEAPTRTAPSASKLKIEPISKPEDLKPEAKEAETPDEKPDEVTDTDDDQSDDSRDTLKDASPDEQDLIDKKAAEHQANINKIALARTYYLPINQVVRRRSKQVVIAGTVLAVLLGLAWLDVSLDAGLITIPGVEAPTHFFSN